MVSELANAYDEFPYEDGCYPFSHPDRLATLAAVYGLAVPPIERCRVLELGCARGGNLLPMALELPGATFLGIDLSSRQIADASGLASRLGVKNVEFRAMSLADVDAGFGEFDYVVCHGVYSWVPEPVRDAILAICARNLSPNGLAYVSYNTYPGWSARGMVRDLVLFHARAETSPAGRVERTRGFLEELAGILPNPTSPYANILRSEGKRFSEATDSYLVHEAFEEDNQPCSVHAFLKRAEAAGLEFVAEAETPGLLLGLPGGARDAISRWADDVSAREQYLDLVVNRAFRRSILRRAGGKGPGTPSADAIYGLSVRTGVTPASPGADVTGDTPVEFTRPGNAGSLTTSNPLLKAALTVLFDDRPRALAFETLWTRVRDRLTDGGRKPALPDDEARKALRESLLRLFLSDLVDLHVRPPRFSAEVSERPVASPLARLQAADRSQVTSLLRRAVDLDELGRAVLLQLDGSRTAADVLEAIIGRVVSGSLELSDGTRQVRDERAAREILSGEIEPALLRLARAALLAG